MSNSNLLLEKEFECLHQKYFNARETTLKYINIYITSCGLLISFISFIYNKSPENIIHILPFVLFLVFLGMCVFYSAVEATAIVIWSLYRINLIKKEIYKEGIINERIVYLEKFSFYNKYYLFFLTNKFACSRFIANFVEPFSYKNFREQIIMALNVFLLIISIVIYQIHTFNEINILLTVSVGLLLFSIQVRFYHKKFSAWKSIISELQTQDF